MKAHVTAIFEKLRVRNRTQAVMLLRSLELGSRSGWREASSILSDRPSAPTIPSHATSKAAYPQASSCLAIVEENLAGF